MLKGFPGFQTRDPDVNRRVALSEYSARHFDSRPDEKPLRVRANWADTKRVRVTNVSCSASTMVRYDPVPFVRLYFRQSKSTSLLMQIGGKTQELSLTSNGCVIAPAGIPFEVNASADHEVLALRLGYDQLISVLGALLGEEVSGGLELEPWLASADPAFYSLRNAVSQFISDLEDAPAHLLSVTDAFGQAVLVRFLMSSAHSFSKRLRLDIAPPSKTQLKDVEAYIEANWRRDLEVEELARVSGLGVRSIYRHFRSVRGMSPQEFIRDIRLKRCREMLTAENGRKGVLDIAIHCGFHSLGHFAEDYRMAFGELPSQTLRRAREVNR